ncbi:MAG: hypothetical protein LBV41_07020 [Cytophagaceae bacterium]|jgi:protease II|nr:hypothetical protein [Cytophagaceae bacterium]
MKKFLIVLSVVFFGFMLSSCKNMYGTQSSGKDNVSYVIVVREGVKYNNVSIIVDGTQHSYETVRKIKNKRKAEKVEIATGHHNIKVVVDGNTVTDENVFIGLQETKMIVLK